MGLGKTSGWGKSRRESEIMPNGGRIGAGTVASLFESLFEERARKLPAGLRPLERAAELYGPGYMAGQERFALTGAKAALGARGLGGTTRPGAVSAGMRAGFEDVRRQGLTGALGRISEYIGGTTPTAGTLAHLATGGFSGMLQERALAGGGVGGGALGGATYGQYDPNYMQSLFGAPNIGSPFFGAGGAGAGYTVSGADYGVGRIGGAQARAGAAGPVVQRGEALEPGLPAGYKRTPTGVEPMGEPPTPYYEAEGGWEEWEEPKPDLSSTYQSWRAEMKRRYPGKPVMPQSRWERLVYPKMGIS